MIGGLAHLSLQLRNTDRRQEVVAPPESDTAVDGEPEATPGNL